MGLSQILIRSRPQVSKIVDNIKKLRIFSRGDIVSSSHRPYQTSSVNENAIAAPERDQTEYLIKYRKGDELFGFSIQEIKDVPEFHLTALRLNHVKTGADYLHIAKNDTNNVFAVAFRTPPSDDSGVCHILEHLALCGSKKFPCRDPFFKMLSRSLSTYMNAWTGYDFTMYPFSSQNVHDFNNLLTIYLDAAFFPNLRKIDFLQEGWRLENEVLEDPNTPIIFKGVVFNEMKGVFSSSVDHFVENLKKNLFPDNVYKYCSGGHPLAIPSLTWEHLVNYHKTFYHPSNARFYSYGSLPLESHLETVNNYVLSKFDKKEPNSTIKPQAFWTEPRSANISCVPDPMAPNPEKQTTISIAYSLTDIKNTNEAFTLAVLCNLLTGGSTSPFYKSLLTSGIGADYAPNSGYNGHNLQSSFSVGLSGIHENDAEKVAQLIEDTFDDVIRDGFPENRIEAVLHAIELSCKHQTTKFGLNLGQSINSVWNHGGNPIDTLEVNKQVQWFRMQLKNDSQYLQKKTKQYFKENNHKLTLKMSPDPSFAAEQDQKEAELLKNKVAKLNEDEKAKIREECLQLSKEQENIEDLSSLPTLQVTEVEPIVEKTSFVRTLLENVPVTAFREPTNGVVYFRAIAAGNKLPEHLVPYLPIFSNVITSMGTNRLNYMEQDEATALYTGGLNASVHLVENPSQRNSLEQGLLLSSYCLERNAPRMFGLWNDIFEKVKFEDTDRLAQLIRIIASDLSQGLIYSGHSYAMTHAGSNLTAAGYLAEKFSGVTRIKHQNTLAELQDYHSVAEKLKEIAIILLAKNVLRCSLHTTAQFHSEGMIFLENFLSAIPRIEEEALLGFVQKDFTPTNHQTHFIMPLPVNYVSQATNTVGYNHPDFASLRILSKLLSRKFLHREIREQGGAYGSGATIGGGGVFSFYSYRDPNLSKTLDAFSRSLTWAKEGNFTPTDIDEAKLGVFSELDHPVAPGDKGLPNIISGFTDDMRQENRNRIFAAAKDNIVNVAQKYFTNNENKGVAVIGPENDFTKNNDWKIIKD